MQITKIIYRSDGRINKEVLWCGFTNFCDTAIDKLCYKIAYWTKGA